MYRITESGIENEYFNILLENVKITTVAPYLHQNGMSSTHMERASNGVNGSTGLLLGVQLLGAAQSRPFYQDSGWLVINLDIVSKESVRRIYSRLSKNGLSPGFTFPLTVVTAI